ADAAEIKQAGRDRFTAESFAFYQPEIFIQIIERFAFGERAVFDAVFESFGTGRYCRERIIYLVNDAGRKPSDRREFFRAPDGVDRFDTHGYVFADRDYMRNFAGVRICHRHFADDPMFDRTVRAGGLLFDAFDLSGAKRSFKFLAYFFFGVTRQNLKNVLANRVFAHYALRTDLALAVPRDDPIIAVNDVYRKRQRVHHGFGKAAMLFFRAVYGTVDRRFVMRRKIYAHRRHTRRRVDQAAFRFIKFAAFRKSGDDRTANFAIDVQRRNVFEFVVVLIKQKIGA